MLSAWLCSGTIPGELSALYVRGTRNQTQVSPMQIKCITHCPISPGPVSAVWLVTHQKGCMCPKTAGITYVYEGLSRNPNSHECHNSHAVTLNPQPLDVSAI